MSYENPTVEESLLENLTRRAYKKVPVGRFKNIQMVVEKGKSPDISPSEARDLVHQGRRVVKLFTRMRQFRQERNTTDGLLKDGAAAHPGFGGFDLTDSGFHVRVKPVDEIKWNGPVLKERLGESASAIVSEKLQMTFVVPLGHVLPGGEVITAERATAVFYSGILALGLSQDDEATTFSTSTEYDVNETLLGDMVKNGQVGSLDGTAEVTRRFELEIKP
ncbi:MAG: hypothetical protein ACREF7_01205 [Candidatus Saccharimonadales bacterium]